MTGSQKNYLTQKGYLRLHAELKTLLNLARPEVVAKVAWAAGNGDRSENADYIYGKRRLREIDRRIRFITKRLEIAEVIDPAKQKFDVVRFGATVEIANMAGQRKKIVIVGVDEIDLDLGHISWNSPLGRSLLNKGVGDVASFDSPAGRQEWEVLSILYKAI